MLGRIGRSRRGRVALAIVLIAGADGPGRARGHEWSGRGLAGLGARPLRVLHRGHGPHEGVAHVVQGQAAHGALAEPLLFGRLRRRAGQGAHAVQPTRQTDISNGHLVTSSITKANTRLVCWSISPKALRLPPSVRLKNQFGTAVLRPTAARSLCLPSWKNQAKPLKFPSSSAPASLDSYACYSAVHPAGTPSFSPPRSVALKDQFGAATTRVGAPNMVCLPTARQRQRAPLDQAREFDRLRRVLCPPGTRVGGEDRLQQEPVRYRRGQGVARHGAVPSLGGGGGDSHDDRSGHDRAPDDGSGDDRSGHDHDSTFASALDADRAGADLVVLAASGCGQPRGARAGVRDRRFRHQPVDRRRTARAGQDGDLLHRPRHRREQPLRLLFVPRLRDGLGQRIPG